MTNLDKEGKALKIKDDDYTVDFHLGTNPVYEKFVWWNPISWGRWLFQRDQKRWTHIAIVKQKRFVSLFTDGTEVSKFDMDKEPVDMKNFTK